MSDSVDYKATRDTQCSNMLRN